MSELKIPSPKDLADMVEAADIDGIDAAMTEIERLLTGFSERADDIANRQLELDREIIECRINTRKATAILKELRTALKQTDRARFACLRKIKQLQSIRG